MPSRDELEQDLRIVEAERDAAEKRVHELEKELAALRGETALVRTRAAEAGVEIPEEEVDEHRQLEVLREGVDQDLAALRELQSPTGALLKHEPHETPLDIVRANQRERAELQQRTGKTTTLLSRIAGIVKMDRWDDRDGETLLERLQALSQVQPKLAAAIKNYKRELEGTPEIDPGPVSPSYLDNARRRSYLAGAVAALEAIHKAPITPPAPDPNAARRIVFVVSGHEVAMHVQPSTTIASARAEALSVMYPTGRMPQPAEAWLVYDENGTPLDGDKALGSVVLPTERVVITLPSGYGG